MQWKHVHPFLTVQRKLLVVWFALGVVPLALQLRSYYLFVKPHRIPETLAASPDLPKETTNLTEVCPVEAMVLAGVWWNFEATHYYLTNNGILCHAVVPQYNTHGNYFIKSAKTAPFHTTPSTCANDSLPFDVYFYHASIGFYSFYEQETGTYCTQDHTAYIAVEILGTYDINGSFLAKDTGGTDPRVSYWYSTVGAVWILYRALMIRRSFVSCRRYGARCDEMRENLQLSEATVFVQESMRLSAQGATNYQRSALLYLIVEGIMTDLFLIIANDGWLTKVQYASLGYNLSGLMLLMFEMIERMQWLSELWRLRIKRLFFSYETALVGEFVSALAFQKFLTGLNKSDLKRSKPTALAVSYYFWSLVCHGIVVVIVIGIISVVRGLWGLSFAWLKHRSFAIFSDSCCVDTALGTRNRIVLLGGYLWEGNDLYYTPGALKAFGVLKMEENRVEYLAMHKLNWFSVPINNLIGVGIISGQRVEPCQERLCAGIVSFFDRSLGGASNLSVLHHRSPVTLKILVGPEKNLT
eukprot:jgi/Phyca11/124567/e_gw1.54.96.1